MQSLECLKSIQIMKENTWNVRRLINESFVPSAQQTSILYCRLSDFKACWPFSYRYHLDRRPTKSGSLIKGICGQNNLPPFYGFLPYLAPILFGTNIQPNISQPFTLKKGRYTDRYKPLFFQKNNLKWCNFFHQKD